jgi:hypothetical protein
MWGALSDERTDMSFIIAAGPRQRSHFRVLVPWDSWSYFTVSDSRLPFRRLLRLAGSRWRYSTPPPRGVGLAIVWSLLENYKYCDEYDHLLGTGSLKRILMSAKTQQKVSVESTNGVSRGVDSWNHQTFSLQRTTDQNMNCSLLPNL